MRFFPENIANPIQKKPAPPPLPLPSPIHTLVDMKRWTGEMGRRGAAAGAWEPEAGATGKGERRRMGTEEAEEDGEGRTKGGGGAGQKEEENGARKKPSMMALIFYCVWFIIL